MKKCIICGVEIKNGENGCAMYAECDVCSPINYYATPRPRVEYSEGDCYRAESRCIADMED